MSTPAHSTERQLANVELDLIFEDRVSGVRADGPALRELIDYVRAGDTIVVHSLDRLARNLDDLRSLVREITA
jgi:DNA invertase Pin-like site-specific DNA recombinase